MFREELTALKNDSDNKGLCMVSDFWDQVRNNGKWRIWKDLGYNEESPLKAQAGSLALALEQRKILVSSSSDQLRWGRNTKGKFNLKEAKQEVMGFNFVNPDQVWKKLWQNSQWMKIKLFSWLVHQRKILTWENLLKKGFIGPSNCYLCGTDEETIEHLLNLCPFTSKVWDWVASIFRQTDRDSLNISNTSSFARTEFLVTVVIIVEVVPADGSSSTASTRAVVTEEDDPESSPPLGNEDDLVADEPSERAISNASA